MTPRQWLRNVKLFELELSTRKIAKQLKLFYPIVFKAFNTIRSSTLAHTPDAEQLLSGEVELDECGRGAAGKIPVFGILERNGLVSVQVVPTSKMER